MGWGAVTDQDAIGGQIGAGPDDLHGEALAVDVDDPRRYAAGVGLIQWPRDAFLIEDRPGLRCAGFDFELSTRSSDPPIADRFFEALFQLLLGVDQLRPVG